MSSAFQSDTANKSSLSESERQLQLVLDHSPDMMAFIKVEPGPVFRVVSINEKYLAGVRSGGFNLAREDLVGKTLEEVFGKVQASPELIKEMVSRYQRVVVTLQPHRFEEVVETPQGRYYGESLLLPGIDGDGRCGFIYYSSRDITERKSAEKKLQRLNRLYAVSSSINQAIVRIREVNKLYEQACRIAVEEGGLKMAWLGLLDPVRGIIKPVASWGFDRGYTDTITISNKDAPDGRGPGGRAIRSGECAFSNDIAKDENFAWRSEALDRGYRSCAVFPLKSKGIVTGFLAIYADQVSYFKEEELRLLTALAENISFAIESREQEAEKERVERALRKNEEELRVTFENAGISIALVDNAGRLVKCNPALQKFVGYSEAELREMSIADITHPDDMQTDWSLYQELMEGKRDHYEIEKRYFHKNGEIKWGRLTVSVVRGADQQPQYSIGMVEDVTEYRQREQKLREQAALLDKAQDAILVRNMEDVVLYWNKGAERLYGYTADQAVGRKIKELIYKNKEASVLSEARSALFSKGEWHGEISQVTKDGREVLVEARWTLMRDEQGQPHSVLAINTDITERKKLESQFLRAQRMESIGTLAGGIAHDLNNVLAPILMSCELLELEVKEPELRDVVTIIKTGAKRGAELVKQVLTFARGVEGRRLALQPKHLIHEVEQMMRETFPKSIQVRVLLSPDLPMVSGDPTQLHQVLLNLCVNARDAMPMGGQLTLRAESVWRDENQAMSGAHSQAREYVVIRVADSGTGIAPEIREKIFDPFFTTKEVGRGTGLGLSTTLAIVKSHDGFMNVASEPGQGSTFEVYLPALRAAPGTMARPAESESPRGNGEMILLVDDEPSILKITKRALEGYGYRVLTAENGNQAITLYRQHAGEIAVVVTDMMMPLMDGPATIHALRSMNAGVKVIASSGLSTTDSTHRAQEMKVPFLAKPYKAEVLLKALKSLITKK
jgi:PAS domain S-box-containing protein